MPSSRERIARRLARAETLATKATTVPRLPYSSIDSGALELKDIEGNVAGYVGQQFDGTITSAAVGGSWPATASPPLVTPIPGGLRIYWDGTYADDSLTRMDFRRATFHAVTDVDDFDPLDPAQIVGEVTIATGGEVTVSLPPVEHFVFVVVWTDAGKFSVESVPGFATPLELFDAEGLAEIEDSISDLNEQVADAPAVYRQPEQPTVAPGKKAIWFDTDADNVPHYWDGLSWTTVLFGEAALAANAVVAETIAAGALDGKVITGALVQTSLIEEFGIKLVDNNFVAYDEDGLVSFLLNGTTGDLTISNAVMAGGEIIGAEISGGVLTGPTYRTSETGQRVQITERITTVGGLPYEYGLIEFYSGNPNEVSPPVITAYNDTRLQFISGKFNPTPTNYSALTLDPSNASLSMFNPTGRITMLVDKGSGTQSSLELGGPAVSGRTKTVLKDTANNADVTVGAYGIGGKAALEGNEVAVKANNPAISPPGASMVNIEAAPTTIASKVSVAAPNVDIASSTNVSGHVSTVLIKATNTVTPINAKVRIEAASFEVSSWKSADIPWTNIPNTVAVGNLQYCVKAGWVIVRMNASAATASGVTYTVSTSALPVALRPSKDTEGHCNFDGYSGSMVVTPAGQVLIAHVSGATRGGIRGQTMWPVE